MSQLESDIETKVTEYSKEQGCLSLKLNVLGRIGWPDRIYLYYGARVLFIEFKKPGEKPRKIQAYVHSILRKYGFIVIVVDNISDGQRGIDYLTKGHPVV